MALSRKTTLQLAAKLRKQRPVWRSNEDDAIVLLWRRMVQAVAASAVANCDLGLFVDAVGYDPSAEVHNQLHDAAMASLRTLS